MALGAPKRALPCLTPTHHMLPSALSCHDKLPLSLSLSVCVSLSDSLSHTLSLSLSLSLSFTNSLTYHEVVQALRQGLPPLRVRDKGRGGLQQRQHLVQHVSGVQAGHGDDAAVKACWATRRGGGVCGWHAGAAAAACARPSQRWARVRGGAGMQALQLVRRWMRGAAQRVAGQSEADRT